MQDAQHPLAPAEGGRSSLEVATKLGTRSQGRWVLGLFPDAAEAGGTFQSTL